MNNNKKLFFFKVKNQSKQKIKEPLEKQQKNKTPKQQS